MADIIKLSEYRDWLRDLKQQIKTEQIKAALSVNSQMIMLYWDLGRQITEKQEKTQWGSGFIEQLSKDLRKAFPEMTGFSAKNLRTMRVFYKFYSQNQIWKQVVSKLQNNENNVKTEQVVQQFLPQVRGKLQTIGNKENIIHPQIGDELEAAKLFLIPWGHHVKIMQKAKDIKEALFYLNKPLKTTGAAQYSNTKSKPIFTADREKPSQTSTSLCRHRKATLLMN